MKAKKIIVFGSNSFAARSFIKFALNLGYHITATSRSDEIKKIFKIYSSETSKKNFEYMKFNINSPVQINDIFHYIKYNKIEKIVDFASQSMVGESWDAPVDWIRTNCVGKIQLIEALLKLQTQVKFKYIRISTPEVYGSSNHLINEEKSFSPSTPYAVTQCTADYLFKIYSKFKKLNAITLRFANFYGPGQQLYRIIPKTIISILFKKKLKIHGDGNSVRSFIFSNDFSSAIINAFLLGKSGETYNISGTEFITIRNLVKKISDKMKYPYDELVGFSIDRLAKDQKYLLCSKKAKKELNWKDNYSLDKGLDQTIKWYKDNQLNLKLEKNFYKHKK